MAQQIHPKLAHLTLCQIEQLTQRYYHERAADLVAEFNISVGNSSELYRLLPAIISDESCPYCDIPMQRARPSKTEAQSSRRSVPDPYCPSCNHRRHASGRRCLCGNCDAAVRAHTQGIEQARRNAIVNRYTPALDAPFDVNATICGLTLTTAVALLAFYRNCHSDDGLVFTSLRPHRPLTPTLDLHIELLSRLRSEGLIAVDPSSPLDGFEFDETNAVAAFIWLRVYWRLLPGATPQQVAEIIADIERSARDGCYFYTEDDRREALGLWEELALEECLQFFNYQGDAHRLPNPSGDKTKLMFSTLLKDFAVNQVHNFIWQAAQAAAAYYQRGGVSKTQAGNSMVGTCRSRGDRARLAGWEVKGFRRNHELPRTELSHVLHDTFLHIGEDGFTTMPNLGCLPAAKLPSIGGSGGPVSEIPF